MTLELNGARSCNPVGCVTFGKVSQSGNGGLLEGFLNWLRHTVIDLSEQAVDGALDSDREETVDFEILGDPQHPKFYEMRRRHNEQRAREDRSDAG